MVNLKKKSQAVVPISDILVSVPSGKIRCYITDTFRNDTPEEHVRQRMARSLVEEYGYSKSDIEIERTIIIGRSKKRADIVIFHKDSPHTTENIIIIVEAKKETVKPKDREEGVSQLFSYISATPNAKYGLWVGSEIQAFQKSLEKGKWVIQETLDIPFADGEVHTATSFSALVPATDALKDVFKRCHNYISANQGGSKEAAFHEFLKITFCKAYDERNSETPQFYINPDEQRTKTGQEKVLKRIEKLFAEVCEDYGYIFGQEENINLKQNVCAYIVAELQKYSLLDTDFDYKGQAYEEIVGANSRGERGEFFTPRNLCKLAVDIISSILGEKNVYTVKVLDPACGTGGFLRSFIYLIYCNIYDQELKKWNDTNKARELARSRLKSICDKNVFGIDFNPVLVRAAQMNLVMHGDGSTNIFHENSLLSHGEWDERLRNKVEDGEIDVILTNPPFGDDLGVDDQHVLHQYEISSYGSKTIRSVMAPQELFIERCYKLLKPGGYIGVVTPDNILSNPSYQFIRHWILLKFKIIASISLPTEMFQPSTGTQTSLLIMKKRVKPFRNLEELQALANKENIFMSTPRKIGHDQRGNIILKRDEDGDIIVNQIKKKRIVRSPDGKWKEEIIELQEPIPYDDLPKVFEDFKQWLKRYGGEV